LWPPTLAQTLGCAAFAIILGAIITVATDRGTLQIESDDPSVEVTIRPVNSSSNDTAADQSAAEFVITDTITGSKAKWLRSGEYVLDLKGDKNNFKLDKDWVVLKRGETTIARVTRAHTDVSDLELLPVPWVDGESLKLQITLENGLEIGAFVFSANAAQEGGKDIWVTSLGRYIMLEVIQAFSRVKADRQTFRPLSSFFRHPKLGQFEAAYASTEVTLKTITGGDGKERTRKIELNGIHYDNEQSVKLLRRLPLENGFQATMPLFATFTEGALAYKVEVTARETIEVPAGTFECYRVEFPELQQTYWISADAHRYPVKFEADGLVGSLDTIRVNEPGKVIEYRDKEFGFSVAAPADWYLIKKEDRDENANSDDPTVYQLLDPEAEAITVLRGRPAEILRAHDVDSRGLADMRVKKRTQLWKDFKVRDDSWTERTISGQPGVSFIADFTIRGKAMAQYYVCSRGESTAVEFIAVIDRNKFASFKGQLDAIIKAYKEE
jgi:hypothetical protein